MPKKISIENYARRRGFQAHTLRMSNTTPASKLAHEYFDLLQIENPYIATQEFLKKWSELNNMKNNL